MIYIITFLNAYTLGIFDWFFSQLVLSNARLSIIQKISYLQGMGFDTEEKRVQPLWQFHQVVDEVSSSDFEDIFRSITSDDRPFWHNWELAEENTSTDVSWKNHSTFLDALSQEHGGPIIVFQKFFGDYVIRVTLDTLLEYVSLVEIAIIRYDFIYVIGSADFNPPNDDDEVDMTPILPPDPREKILQPV